MKSELCDPNSIEGLNVVTGVQLEETVDYIHNNFSNVNEPAKQLLNYKKFVKYLEKNYLSFGLLDVDALFNKCPELVKMFDKIFEIDDAEKFMVADCMSDFVNAYFLIKGTEEMLLPEDNSEYTDDSVMTAARRSRVEKNTMDLIRQYLNEISVYGLLTFDQEQELAKRIKLGDMKATDTLAKHNLKLVISYARRFVNKGLDLEDLIQEGNLGLMKAVERFDGTKGYKFSTYASWWIKQSITRAIADQSRTIRVPVHAHECILKLKKAMAELYCDYDDALDYEKLAEITNMPVDNVKLYLQYATGCVSLSSAVGEEENSELGNLIADPNNDIDKFTESSFSEELMESIKNSTRIDDRAKEILKLRTGFYNDKCYTLEEIGNMYNLTRERIRQIQDKALRYLSRDIEVKKFAPDSFKQKSRNYANEKKSHDEKSYTRLLAKYNIY